MVSSAPTSCTSVSTSLLPPSFHDWVESLLLEYGVPGVSLGIVKLNGLGEVEPGTEKVEVELKQYGFATLPSDESEGKKVTEDTMFGIASNSKAFTAACIAKLVEEEMLTWRTPVTNILSTISFRDVIAHECTTIIDLLAHRTGLPRHENAYQKEESLSALVSKIKGLRPSSEFREYQQYNNQTYMLAAYIVRHLSGMPFTAYASENLLGPLGMTSTTFRAHKMTQLASSYVTLEDKSTVEVPYAFDVEEESIELAAGPFGLVSNSKDMLKWVEFLIRQRHSALKAVRNDDEASTSSEPGKPISPRSVLYMTSSHSIEAMYSKYTEESAKTYGLAFRLGSYQGHEMIMHGGDVPGCGSQVAWSSDHGFGVACLTNVAGAGNNLSGIVTYRVFEELLGLQQVDWNARYLAERKKTEAKTNKSRDEWNSVPAHPTGLELEKFLGNYNDFSYGNVSVFLPAAKSGSMPMPDEEELRKKIATARLGTPALKAIDLLIHAPGYFGFDHAALQLKPDAGGNVFRATRVLRYDPAPSNPQGLLLNNPASNFEVEFILQEDKVTEMIWKAGSWGAGEESAKRDEEGRTEVAFSKS